MASVKELPAPSLSGEPNPTPQTQWVPQPYFAFQAGQNERRYLQIRVRDGFPAECPSYATLTNLIYEWRIGQVLMLQFGQAMAVTIQGRNLKALYDAICEWRAEWVAEFSPKDYEPPSDASAPFIEGIEITTNRPSPPLPPPDKLH